MVFARGSARRWVAMMVMGVCVLGLSQISVASSETRDSLFLEIEAFVTRAQDQKAQLFAPHAFGVAMTSYQDALDDFHKGKDLKGIQRKLKRAEASLHRAMDVCATAEVTFQSLMRARLDAASVGAGKHSQDLLVKAVTAFKRAVKRLEGGDVDEARELAWESESFFRQAELDTIKKKYLTKTRVKIAYYDDLGRRNNAPKTFSKAYRLLTRAEKKLEEDRYTMAEVVVWVQEAEYELAHTEYIHTWVEKLNESGAIFEDVIIAMESQLVKIAEGLDINLMFDRGVSGATWQLLDAVQELKARGDAKDLQIAALSAEVAGLQEKVANLSQLEQELMAKKAEVEAALKRQTQDQRFRQMKIKRIRDAFTSKEGKVLMDGERVIIRLYGLSFSSGKAIIDYKYFGLLAKVRDTFTEFPGCRVVIEGHTDSVGSEKINKGLSTDRADSVRHYLIANSPLTETQISAKGFGESTPVASNGSREGRARNRRIDVVIVPAQE